MKVKCSDQIRCNKSNCCARWMLEAGYTDTRHIPSGATKDSFCYTYLPSKCAFQDWRDLS